jgi:hypothetical protein
MGLSSSKPVRRQHKYVSILGHSNSGKSHFLSVVCGDGSPNDETRHPTAGYYCETLCHAGVDIDFVEHGWTTVAMGCYGLWRERVDMLMWFIDEHASRTQVQLARSHLLGFVQEHPGIGGLCIILNRRLNASIEGIAWNQLHALCDVDALHGLFARGVFLSELSYEDDQAPLLFLDWIIE